MSTWQRRIACLIDLHAWGRRPGPGLGKKEQESKSIKKNNAVIEPVSGEITIGRGLGGAKVLLSDCGIFIVLNEWLDLFILAFSGSKCFTSR